MIQKTLRVAAGLVVGIFLIYAGLAIFTARSAVFPWWYKGQFVGEKLPDCSSYQRRVYEYCSTPEKSLGLDYKDFSAETRAPGNKLVGVTGWWVPLRQGVLEKGTVVLVHGGGADRRAMLKHVKYLNEAGFQALLIDCYNHGLTKGDRRGISFGLWESHSIVAAVEWADRHLYPAEKKPIFVMGTSQGGFAALRAAALSEKIQGVVAENPYVSVRRVLLEFPALEWLPRFVKESAFLLIGVWLGISVDQLDAQVFASQLGKRPVLLIHGQEDKVTASDQSRAIYDLLPGPNKDLWLVPGAEHEYIWNVAKVKYEARVLHFLEQSLMQPSLGN